MLKLLKQLARGITRVRVLDPSTSAGLGQSPSLGVEVTPIKVRDAGEMEPQDCEEARVSWPHLHPWLLPMRLSSKSGFPSQPLSHLLKAVVGTRVEGIGAIGPGP